MSPITPPGPRYPNATGAQPTFIPKGWMHDCGAGELYDLLADPSEHVNIASTHQALLASMQSRLQALNKDHFAPVRGSGDVAACEQAVRNGGFYGPFVTL
jgi:hypothetical protein